MPKATDTITTGRRAMLAGCAAVTVTGAVAAAADPGSDAALIRWCAEYIAAVRAYGAASDRAYAREGRDLTRAEEEALWAAIDRAEEEANARPPQTIAGVLALAQVSQTMASIEGTPNDADDWGGRAAEWSVAASQALLRLAAEGRV